MKTTKNQTYDVIISGAGPVGLFLACELALAKCAVLILEKAPNIPNPLKQLPFGIRGLSAPTIEALYRRGMLDELQIHKHLKNPHMGNADGAKRQVGHFAGIPFLQGNIDTSKWNRLPSSTAMSLISEMEELETILTRRAVSMGVAIKYETPVTGLKQSSDEVFIQSDHLTFKAKWLIGCDGARSVIRKLGGFEFAGTEPEFTGYTARVNIADPEKLKPGRNLTPQGMYLQSQPGYLAIQDFDSGAFHSSGQPITLEHIQDVLRRVSGTDVTLTKLHIATTWTDRARQAIAYRNGRVLLAGDAAHIHAPLGGQGLNLGLGDAMNLGWKLAATIHQTAPEGLLDTYFTERYPIGAAVLDWSRAQAAIMNPSPQARALNTIIRDLMDTEDGATYFASRVWGVNTHYDLGGGHPLTGHSVPNFEFEDGITIGELLRDGKGILLDFTSSSSLKSFTDEFTAQIKYVSAKAKEQSGLNALLIRPDGYVAWASDKGIDKQALAGVARKWFMHN